jgi:hypothetical protein
MGSIVGTLSDKHSLHVDVNEQDYLNVTKNKNTKYAATDG